MKRRKLFSFFHLSCLGTFIAAVVAGLYIWQPPLLQQIDRKIYDAFLHARAGGEPSAIPVIIDIDEQSLKVLGQWPWPRYLLARLLMQLKAGGVAAVGLDILLAESDRTSPRLLRENLQRDLEINIDFVGLPESLEDNDSLLAEVLRHVPVVLGCYMQFDEHAVPPDPLPDAPGIVELLPVGSSSLMTDLHVATGMLLPLPSLMGSAVVGPTNTALDVDGLIRSVPLLNRIGDRIYPSLALRTLMRAMGTNTLVLRSGIGGLESVQVGELDITVTPEGHFQIPFRGGRGIYHSYSAVDIIEGNVNLSMLKGKIAFVGSSATALMDIQATPFGPYFPGLEVHAAVVDALLSGREIYLFPETVGLQVIAIFVFGLVCAFLFGLTKPVVYLLSGGGLAVATLWGTRSLFLAGTFISPLYVLLTIVVEGLVVVFFRLWAEEKQFRQLQHSFGRYVTPEVVAHIAAQQKDVFLGEKREVTIIFTDIRGFTALSEKLDPVQVVALLNRYFTPMTALVRNSGGTLDKFMGDALMAFWNAPLDVADHPVRAVETALAIHDNLHLLNDELGKDFGVRLKMGIGLHTGPVFVGNMGSQELLNYTIIGDSVNLAARLEKLTARYGIRTVVSDDTRLQCGDAFTFIELDKILVRGKTVPIKVFAPVTHEKANIISDEINKFRDAVDIYEQGNFAEARKRFLSLSIRYPEKKIYSVYIERCTHLVSRPPVSWTGVWMPETL